MRRVDILSTLNEGDSFVGGSATLVWKLRYQQGLRTEVRLTPATSWDNALPRFWLATEQV